MSYPPTDYGSRRPVFMGHDTINPIVAYSDINILAASFNGNFSALIQPDVSRNLIATKAGIAGAGGSVTVTGTDQFGQVRVCTYTFPGGAATYVLPCIFSTINVTGIVIAGLTAGDTISLGTGNKLGLSNKIYAGAVKKVTKNGVGNYTNYVEDAVYHGVTMNDNIVAADIYQIVFFSGIGTP